MMKTSLTTNQFITISNDLMQMYFTQISFEIILLIINGLFISDAYNNN